MHLVFLINRCSFCVAALADVIFCYQSLTLQLMNVWEHIYIYIFLAVLAAICCFASERLKYLHSCWGVSDKTTALLCLMKLKLKMKLCGYAGRHRNKSVHLLFISPALCSVMMSLGLLGSIYPAHKGSSPSKGTHTLQAI